MVIDLTTRHPAAGVQARGSETDRRSLHFRGVSERIERGADRARLRALAGDPYRCRPILRVENPDSELWTYLHPGLAGVRLQVLLEGGRVAEARFVSDEGPGAAPRVEEVEGFWRRVDGDRPTGRATAPEALRARGIAC